MPAIIRKFFLSLVFLSLFYLYSSSVVFASYCNNRSCEPGENCDNCSADCGQCSQPTPTPYTGSTNCASCGSDFCDNGVPFTRVCCRNDGGSCSGGACCSNPAVFTCHEEPECVISAGTCSNESQCETPVLTGDTCTGDCKPFDKCGCAGTCTKICSLGRCEYVSGDCNETASCSIATPASLTATRMVDRISLSFPDLNTTENGYRIEKRERDWKKGTVAGAYSLYTTLGANPTIPVVDIFAPSYLKCYQYRIQASSANSGGCTSGWVESNEVCPLPDTVYPNKATCSASYNASLSRIDFSWGWPGTGDQTCSDPICEPAVQWCNSNGTNYVGTDDFIARADNTLTKDLVGESDTNSCLESGPFWWQIADQNASPTLITWYYNTSSSNITYPPGGTSYNVSCTGREGHTLRIDVEARDARGNMRGESPPGSWPNVCSASAICPAPTSTPIPVTTFVPIPTDTPTLTPTSTVTGSPTPTGCPNQCPNLVASGPELATCVANNTNLSWVNVAGNVGYKIYRNGAYCTTVGQNSTSTTDTGSWGPDCLGISAGTTYTYGIKTIYTGGCPDSILCTNDGGPCPLGVTPTITPTTTPSNTPTPTITLTPTATPTPVCNVGQPSGLTATRVGANVNIQFTDNAIDEDNGFELQRWESQSDGTYIALQAASFLPANTPANLAVTGTVSVTQNNIPDTTCYHWRIRSRRSNPVGCNSNWTNSNVVCPAPTSTPTVTPTSTPTPVCVPTAPSVSGLVPNGIIRNNPSLLSWNLINPATDWGESCGVTSRSISVYLVEKSVYDSVGIAQLDNPAYTSYTCQITGLGESSTNTDCGAGILAALAVDTDYYWNVVANNGNPLVKGYSSAIFRIVNSDPWWQVDSGDVHANTTIDQVIAPDLLILDNIGFPGVVSFGTSLGTARDRISFTNWNFLKSYGWLTINYQYLMNILDVSTSSPISTMPASSGTYYANAAINIDFNSFPSGEKIVIFVNGSATITQNVEVPVGSFFALVASGNITFSSDVTKAEGFYLANNNLTVASNGGVDVPFEGAGSFIGWGGVEFNRDLGVDGNQITPQVKITFRPDLYINAPGSFTFSTPIFSEVAP